MHITKRDAPQEGYSKADLNPAGDTYGRLIGLFDELNMGLFEGRLRRPQLGIRRHNNSMGSYDRESWENQASDKADKLTLNPDYLREASTRDVLVIMAHLMLHLWQAYYGKPSRNGYHNREFADMAKKIGLFPSDTGAPGGKETGQRISHFIVEGSPFHLLATDIERRGIRLRWHEIEKKKAAGRMSHGEESQEDEAGKSGKRIRYFCPSCHEEGRNTIAWGKDGLEISCTVHGVPMTPS